MMSGNTIRDEDILGLQEIVSGQNLDDKIASAGAAKDIYNLINCIFNNNGIQLDDTYDMNKIAEGVYRQGGVVLPLNSPSGANNAYILVLKRVFGGGYGATAYCQFWMSLNANGVYFRTIVPELNIYNSWGKL